MASTGVIDRKRLDELHAAPRVDGISGSQYAEWCAEIEAAWPAVSARIALLEEFVTKVRYADGRCLDETKANALGRAVAWLDSELKKASEPT